MYSSTKTKKNFVVLAGYRGVSSTVRRCIDKENGREFACKIIDVSGAASDPEGSAIRESTRREISILRRVAGHPYISMLINSYTLLAVFNHFYECHMTWG